MSDRCPWCGQDPLYMAYHDHEWGVPEWDSRALWEKLVLDGFHPQSVANWGEVQVAEALANPGIIRHRGKIEATVKNARAYLALQEKGDFAALLWNFVGGTPLQNTPAAPAQIPTQTPASEAMSKMLRQSGFTFVGPTIVYAFMQACGLVNDHLVTCPAHSRIAALATGGPQG